VDSSVELSFGQRKETLKDLQLLEQADRMEIMEEGGNLSKDCDVRERILVESCEWKQEFFFLRGRSFEMTRTASSIFNVGFGVWVRQE
jgi:hypothetical protein